MSYSNDSAFVESPAARVASAVFAAVAESNNVVRRAVAAVRADYIRRVTYRQLNALDDRTLSDIGLSRDSIREAVDSMGVE